MSESSDPAPTPDVPGIDEAADAADRDVRVSSEEGDDLPVTPPDSQPRMPDAGGGDADTPESIDQRIQQEVPDAGTAYGAPESVIDEATPDRLGGRDPGSIPAEEDVLGSSGTP